MLFKGSFMDHPMYYPSIPPCRVLESSKVFLATNMCLCIKMCKCNS